MRRSRRALTHCLTSAALFVAVVALVGCVPEGLAFRIDDRISITSPRDRADVSLPFTIEWTATGVDDVHSYGVYLDRTPVRPGAQFDEHPRDALRTTETSVEVTRVPTLRRGDERHRATIVLLDEDGRRMGESAFEVTFDVEDPS